MTDNSNFNQTVEHNQNSATTENSQVNHLEKSEFVEEIEEDIIRLLGERLVVERSKIMDVRKYGSVLLLKMRKNNKNTKNGFKELLNSDK